MRAIAFRHDISGLALSASRRNERIAKSWLCDRHVDLRTDLCLSVLEGHRGRPQPLDFGHVPWSPNLP